MNTRRKTGKPLLITCIDGSSDVPKMQEQSQRLFAADSRRYRRKIHSIALLAPRRARTEATIREI